MKRNVRWGKRVSELVDFAVGGPNQLPPPPLFVRYTLTCTSLLIPSFQTLLPCQHHNYIDPHSIPQPLHYYLPRHVPFLQSSFSFLLSIHSSFSPSVAGQDHQQPRQQTGAILSRLLLILFPIFLLLLSLSLSLFISSLSFVFSLIHQNLRAPRAPQDFCHSGIPPCHPPSSSPTSYKPSSSSVPPFLFDCIYEASIVYFASNWTLPIQW